MLGVAAQRIVRTIRKPRNNANEAIAPKPEGTAAFRASCCVAPLAHGACHGLRVASCISSRKAAVAATRDLFRGSLDDRDRLYLPAAATRARAVARAAI